MKSVFEPSTREELKSRINSVNENTAAQWGKMNVFQMLKHCTICEGMFLGEVKIKRVLIGRLIGPMVLKKVLKDDAPFGRSSPTSRVLVTLGATGDIAEQKNEWISRIESYGHQKNLDFIHPFFGPMSHEQIGMFSYKHADHHLRQFGV